MKKINLNLSNNFVFASVMSDKNICKQFLENLLEIEIAEIVFILPEMPLVLDPVKKGSRLDVFVVDKEGRMFDIELQNTQNSVSSYLAKRTRYYHSAMDVQNFKKGMDYSKLTASYVIFICTFDEFGYGLPRYTFDKLRCTENPEIILQTDSKVVILNTKAADKEASPELRGLFRYIEDSTEDVLSANETEFLQEVHLKTESVVDDRGIEFMTYQELIDQAREAGLSQGISQGHQERSLEIAKALKENGADIELITKSTGLTPEEIETL